MGVNEVFEDLAYNIAYGEVYNKLNSVIPLDDGYLKDALKSGASIMFSSALMLYMSKQEKFINDVTNKVQLALAAVFGNVGSYVRNKFGHLKGRKLKILSSIFGSVSSEKVEQAKMVIAYGDMIHQGQQVSTTSHQQNLVAFSSQNNSILQNSQKLDYAKAKLDSINKSMLLKLFTKRFTAQDVEMVKKITGSTSVDIDNLNKIADFMYVTDSSGNITGLTEQFMTMLNGLGYLNNKVAK
ncbi:hypothetical protein [Campylobacter iguaniorum]|uniref:hypothetical protein n=1 Tax=Campylobacter iguaniorum TaxID=1244531 RepID=UPI001F41E317|nr:hypothetical protein [Campylobacter iguaniorum]